MSKQEKMMLAIIKLADDRNMKAIILQSHIQENGPLSEEAAVEVRKELAP